MRSDRPIIVYTIPYTWRLAWLVVKGFAIVFAILFVLALVADVTRALFRFLWW